jgi:hypothetical protein
MLIKPSVCTMTEIRFRLSSHVQVVVSVVGFTSSLHHGSPSYGLLSGSCARRFVRMSEYGPEPEGTFQDSRPPLQSHDDPSGKTTSISCECGGCAVAVVDTVVTALVAVGVVVLPHALRTSATALSAMGATTGVKRRAFTLGTLGPSSARRAETGNPGPRSGPSDQRRSSFTYLLNVHRTIRAEGAEN